MTDEDIEEYFNKHIKQHLIDENMLQCIRCGRIYTFKDKKELVMYIKNIEGKFLCSICVKTYNTLIRS